MKHYFKSGVVLFILLAISLNFFLFYDGPQCNFVDSFNSSITVIEGPRRVIGLNADTDSLKFGTVSPQTVVRRSVYVSDKEAAKVRVFMEGEFDSWVNITPQEFDLKADERQEVLFAVRVPDYPEEGDYAGKVYFCFKY